MLSAAPPRPLSGPYLIRMVVMDDGLRQVRAGRARLGPDSRVWYVAYGSNTAAERLRCYLAGGRPPGASRTYPGARDPRMPAASVAGELPGVLYFATHSPVWQGGRAFYDPTGTGTCWARAHLLTAAQLSDIAAQEMYVPPGRDLDLSPALATGRSRLGPGRYETVVCPGDLHGRPLLTFTAPWHLGEVPLTVPSAPYVRVIAAGLHEAAHWPPHAVAAYLASRPGAAGHWTAEQVLGLAGEAPDG
jgi:hypothetical protein